MGLIWRLTSPISDDRDSKTRSGIDYLWRDYLDKVCSMLYSRHNNAITIILIDDNPTVLKSIKDDEREGRANTHTNLSNVYQNEAEKFPTLSLFKRNMLKF